jgi:hypothetical protein
MAVRNARIYAAAPFAGTEGAERMIYEARQRAMSRVGAWVERKGSLAGLAADLRHELERDKSDLALVKVGTAGFEPAALLLPKDILRS